MRAMSFKTALIYAVLLHVAMLSFLLIELRHKPSVPPPSAHVTPKKQPNIIKAVSINQQQIEHEVAKLKQQQRLQQSRKQQQIAKMQQQAAAAKRQQQRAKQQLAKLKKEQALTAKREKQRVEKLKHQQQRERAKLAKLKKQRLAQAAKLKAAQKKKLAEAKRKKALQAKAERLLQQQLARDQQQLNAAKQKQINSQVLRYTALIRQTISENWNVPDTANHHLSCVLLIRLSSNGNVLSVRLVKGSGDPILDRSAEAAVYKASPLPVPSNREVMAMFKEIRLTVKPETLSNIPLPL